MSCYHPLKAFRIGVNPSGKPQYKVTGYDVNFVKRSVNDIWLNCYEWTNEDRFSSENIVSDFIEIPCGHCIGCYLDRSRQWADRCMLEAQYHDCNSFLTLTYDDDHLPSSGQLINSDGVVIDSPLHPLCKRDLQLFIKRLRDKIKPVKVRFFACGEYGSRTARPHYHMILFGYDFSEDRVLYKTNFNGEKLYNSSLLDSCWKNGHAVIGDLTWNSAAYVSRYCLKKRYNDLKDFYDMFDLIPEFTVMSRRPGIARQYYEDHKDNIYDTEEIFISDINGMKKLRPPKYFDKLYDIDYPSDFENIKEHRIEFQKIKKDLILSSTDLDYLDYLKVAESNLSARTKILNERSSYESFV